MVQIAAEKTLSQIEFCIRVATIITAQITPETLPAMSDDMRRLVAKNYAMSIAVDYYSRHSSELLAIKGNAIAEAIEAFINTAVSEISLLVADQLKQFTQNS